MSAWAATHAMRTDEQLAEQLARGKTQALDELYRRYAKPLYAFSRSMGTRQEPEDVVHDVFMRVIERIDRFNPQRSSFRTWLYTIARNYCIDLLRRQGKFKAVSLEKPLRPHHEGKENTWRDMLADERENAEQLLARRSDIEAVRDCIQRVEPEEERQAIMLYYLIGKVYREIGEILGKSTSMAKNYVSSAQQKIKNCLEIKGF